MTPSRVEHRRQRTLAGGTVLQAVAGLRDDRLGRGALDLAVGLLRSGARALVVGAGGPLVGELQALGGEWIELDFGSTGFLKQRRVVDALAQVIGSERVDLVHAQGADAARIALAAVQGKSVMLVTSYLGRPPANGWRTTKEDAQARGHLVFACSEFAADLIAQRHGIPGERIVIVPRSIETGWFDPAAVQVERILRLRESWRVRAEARVVLVPGRLAPTQGQMVLVDAARALVNGGLRGVVFVIAGEETKDTEYAAQLKTRIAAQGLAPIFRSVGHCTDMPAAYAAADVVVLPGDRPSMFSVRAVEAQAMSRPVIAANCGAMSEMMLAPPSGDDAPRTGWLFAPDEPLDLARTLATALALDADALDAMADRARHFVETQFSPEKVASRTLAAYAALLAEEEV